MDLTPRFRFKDIVKALESVEWRGDYATLDSTNPGDLTDAMQCCPSCGGKKDVGHKLDCKFLSAFGELRHAKGVRVEGVYVKPPALEPVIP